MSKQLKFPIDQISARLIQLREAKGLSRKQVDDSLSWRSGMLYDLERQRLTLSLEACWQLLKLYNADWSELFSGDYQDEDRDEAIPLLPQIGPLFEIGMIAPRIAQVINLIREDPMIVAELGFAGANTPKPLLQLLLAQLTPVQQRDYYLELCRYVHSTIAADRKIHQVERDAADILLRHAPIVVDDRERKSLLKAFSNRYLGGSIDRKFPRPALKHFLIWVMFVIAVSDGELNYQETEYIKQVAIHIKLDEQSFRYIHQQIQLPAELDF
ncbi:TerB family tellurite resistance protein [Pseudobacteriovorax antillogorgiicola]|uniref:Tellurite resistance protein TerB n=1 Tax=Pseudobacteriovorax antillogorgiicola TaxID=1513793 RepID=A0A1Y6C4M5_9BACT|nr:TerB family tellurite resistance protein [Pseudobacteriovorax antillogorgiicola]TCS49854.1 tellurite resistance protein TerB [Pseudobacteriovorax antillogorgiicola]SMF43750.1 Tellurite resistance protein TerB [Pseudobacteriovorax antillogorgiicola]